MNLIYSVYLALAQSTLRYCMTMWGGALKTSVLQVERTKKAVLEVASKKPLRFPTVDIFL